MLDNIAKLFEELKAKNLGNIIKEVARCKDASEITILLKNNGIEISEDCAKQCYEMYNKKIKLSDETLDKLAGGKRVEVCGYMCPKCGGISGKGGKPLPMFEIESGYETCSGEFYKQYRCPVCTREFTFYPNKNYWKD